jgi:hypothetical protein
MQTGLSVKKDYVTIANVALNNVTYLFVGGRKVVIRWQGAILGFNTFSF